MLNKFVLIGAAMLAVSAGGASAADYDIQITGACDALELNVTNGIVVGQSVTSGCDASNVIGYSAVIHKGIGSPGRVITAAGDLGLSPDAWTWAFNLSTLQATLTGTTDGVTSFSSNFAFTFTKPGAQRQARLPSAVSAAMHQH